MTDPTMQMEYNVHLGQTYILVKVAWAVLRPKKTIGASCKNAEQPLKLGNRGHMLEIGGMLYMDLVVFIQQIRR